jgi:hypothetical protein
MNNTNNPSAFPSTNHGMIISTGMTLRDYFAAKAMQSLITASVTDPGKVGPVNNISEYAYSYADAMLKAREA